MAIRLVDEPEPQAVTQKSTVVFRSVYEGTPPFMAKWFKDETQLITGRSCIIMLDKYSSSLELHSVGTLHTEIYFCPVSNAAGTVKSRFVGESLDYSFFPFFFV